MATLNDEKIGFVGLGAMGRLMAASLVKNGFDVAAYRPSGPNDKDTITFYASPGELARHASAIIICVPDDDAAIKSLEGADGLLSHMRAGQLLINCSTTSPHLAGVLSQSCGERKILFLEAPMSGSTPEAERAELVFFAGGGDEAYARAEPILASMGRYVARVGAAGSGTIIKLAVNAIMGATMNVIAESVTFALKAGVARDVIFAALAEVAVISPHHKRKLVAAQKRDVTPQFPMKLMSKDLGLFVDAARNFNSFSPANAVADQVFGLAIARHGQQDYSSILDALEKSIVSKAPSGQ